MPNKKDMKGAPKITNPPPAIERKGPPPMASYIQTPIYNLVSSKEVVEGLRELGQGWDSEVETLLALPPSLYKTEAPAARYFSSKKDFSLGKVIQDLRTGSLTTPEGDYGIATYETSSFVYFLLIDMNRRILVHDAIICFQDHPPEKEWTEIKARIKSALELAKSSKNPKTLAVYNGTLDLIQLDSE